MFGNLMLTSILKQSFKLNNSNKTNTEGSRHIIIYVSETEIYANKIELNGHINQGTLSSRTLLSNRKKEPI